MMRTHEILQLLLLLSAPFAYSQPAGIKVEFEVTSIKPSPAQTGAIRVGCTGGPGQPDAGTLRCQNMSLTNLIARAYSLAPYQFTAPDWMQSQMFDITAKVPEGATKEQFALMLQNLLIDRFKLKAHHEFKEMTKYELRVAKNGPKVKESVDDPASKDGDTHLPPAPPGRPAIDSDGYPVLAPGRQGMMMMNGRARLFYPNWTMEQLARQLAGQLGKPVTDATGLKGKYDIGLYWSTDTMRAGTPVADGTPGSMPMIADNSGPTLEKAIQDQLGLRLESTKGPVDVLVVDHMDEHPTEN